MTMGSPIGDGSGPGVADTNAIWLLSGDHDSRSPVEGVGSFVSDTSATCLTNEPSARATNTPELSLSHPRYAIDLPSGDHLGLYATPSCDENARVSPLATSVIPIFG